MVTKVDLLLTDALVFNVFMKRWNLVDVAVLDGRFLYVGADARDLVESEKTVSCGGLPLVPGFIDIHLHIESSMCTPGAFAMEMVRHGTTTVVSEPHEIANVFGVDGVKAMIEASSDVPMDIFYGVPSSVPSTDSEKETTGGVIGLDELDALMKESGVVCLGEVMGYRELADMVPSRARNFASYMRSKHPLMAIEGHCPSLRGMELSKVIFSGVDSDHCLQTLDGMIDRMESGMFVEIQEKSISEEIMEFLDSSNLDGLYCLVADDVPPDALLKNGHLDHLIRRSIKKGLSLESALLAATRSPAARIGFRDRGAIAPGRIADCVLLSDRSDNFRVLKTVKSGRTVYNAEKDSLFAPVPSFPAGYDNSLELVQMKEDFFRVKVAERVSSVKCRTMRKNQSNTFTEPVETELPVVDGQVIWQGSDVSLAVVVDRYSGSCRYGQGFVSGDRPVGLSIASSYAHDAHNILIMGDDPRDMAIAMEQVISSDGGICLVSHGKIVAKVALPIAGLMSEAPLEETAGAVTELQETLKSHGMKHPNPVMSICTLTLPVSPVLKITDRGLVDIEKGSLVSLFME